MERNGTLNEDLDARFSRGSSACPRSAENAALARPFASKYPPPLCEISAPRASQGASRGCYAACLNNLLTIVVPVKNEARNLPDCLESLLGFTHVVIVDSGSTDTTAAIAAENGREVIQFVWDGKFPKKRNWVLENYPFRTPWAMFLDADERLTPAFINELAQFLASDKARHFDVIRCAYNNWFAGRMLRHGDPMRKTAIVRVGAAEYEKIDEDHWSTLDMEVHEHLQPKREGACYEIKARLEHHDKRSLESHWQKHIEYANWESARYQQLRTHLKPSPRQTTTPRREKQCAPRQNSSLTPRQKIKYACLTKPWMALAYFIVCYFVKLGFLDGCAGFRFAQLKYRYFRLVRTKILEGNHL